MNVKFWFPALVVSTFWFVLCWKQYNNYKSNCSSLGYANFTDKSHLLIFIGIQTPSTMSHNIQRFVYRGEFAALPVFYYHLSHPSTSLLCSGFISIRLFNLNRCRKSYMTQQFACFYWISFIGVVITQRCTRLSDVSAKQHFLDMPYKNSITG